MARYILNKQWQEVMGDNIARHIPISYSSAIKQPIQWLIVQLLKAHTPYKVTNLGAGMTNITSDNISVCPLCKRKL